MYNNIIQLPKISDPRGNLSFFENLEQIPFVIQRVFWIYDVPGGENRGAHAYFDTEEFIVAISGSFDVAIDNGNGEKQVFHLNRSYSGIYIPPMHWYEVLNFSTNSLCLVCASQKYNPSDYIRNYDEFCSMVRDSKPKFRIPIDSVLKREFQNNPITSTVYDCSIIELDKHHSNRKGNLSVVENHKDIPFDIKRCYYLYDVPGGESRGAHAHKSLFQLVVAASGSFTITLNDGKVKRTFSLNRPYHGLLITPGIWRELDDFSSGSVCLVMASEKYDGEDYIRDYDEFLKYKEIEK